MRDNWIVFAVFAAVFLFNIAAVSAATYYVSTTGSDTNSGSESSPFRTIQRCANVVVAGDTCFVTSGIYNESIVISRSGTNGNLINFISQGKSTLLSMLDINGNYIMFQGFTFSGTAPQWASIVDLNGDYIQFIENTFVDPNIIDSAALTTSGDYLYVGHNNFTRWPMRTAINIVGGAYGIFEKNRIVDSWDIDVFRVFGHDHIIRDNVVINITDGPNANHIDFIQTFGANGADSYNILVEHNFVVDLAGQISQFEQGCGLNPAGSNSQGNLCLTMPGVNGRATSVTSNSMTDTNQNWITGNWQTNHWQGKILSFISGNAEGKMYLISSSNSNTLTITSIQGQSVNLASDGVAIGDSYQIRERVGWWTLKDNLFVNNLQASVSMPGVIFVGNTFINVSGIFSSGSGDRGLTHQSKVYNNIHIKPDRLNHIYHPGIVNKTFYGDYNFVSQYPPLYAKKDYTCPAEYTAFNFCEEQFGKHGINGGDPLFQNFNDAIGPDGIAWTSDDGFIPLSNSVLCSAGLGGEDIGAYDCKGCSDTNPISFFTTDKIGGYEPLMVNFDASKSLSCAGSLSYSWDFGDGNTGTGIAVSHSLAAGINTVTLTVTNNIGRSATYSKVLNVLPTLEPGLVLHMNFDDNILDWSGKNTLANWVGSASYVAGKSGRAIYTNYSYVQVDHNSVLDGMSQLTLSVWAKKDYPSATAQVVTKHVTYDLAIASVGARYRINNGTSHNSEVISYNTGNADTNWHHYALVHNGTGAAAYMDGNRITSRNIKGNIVSNPDRKIVIGKDLFGSSFSGAVDELRVYDRALTASEIGSLFGASTGSQNNPGDLNNDGIVGLSDILIIVPDWGKSSGYNALSDQNTDGVINLLDIMRVIPYWGISY